MRPTTYVLLMILLCTMFLAWCMVIDVPVAQATGSVHGGPYWNEQVYRDQQQTKNNTQRYDDVKYMQEVQQVHMNNERIRRYQQGTSSRRATTYRKTRQPSNSSWNYRRANQ